MLLDSTSSTLKKFLNVFHFHQRVIREIIIFGQNSFVLGSMGSINKHQVTGIQSFTSKLTAMHYGFHVYLESFRNKTTPITDVLIHVFVKPYVAHNIS